MLGIPTRRLEPEWLDSKTFSHDEIRKSLQDLIRINRLFGGYAIYRRAFRYLLAKIRKGTFLTILDVGAGSAGIPRFLHHWLARKGYPSRIIPVDVNPIHLKIGFSAKERQQYPPIVADALSLPFKDRSVDFVISSLFLHHVDEPAPVIREWIRVTRCGVVINDLIRHKIPVMFFRVVSPFITKSFITRHDGIVSIRRAYTPGEIRQFLGEWNDVHIKIYYHWSFRMGLVIEPLTARIIKQME